MKVATAAILVLLSYLLGAVPFALLLGKLRGVDIRKVGSGNIGATNLSRALGRRWGITAFILDFMKGFLPVLAASWIWTEPPGSSGGIRGEHLQIACALASILGHVFPVYLRFRGGKGVATTFGALAALNWEAALAAAVVWLVIYLSTRTVSIASIGAALAFPIATILKFHVFVPAPAAVAVPMDILSVLVGGLIVLRHRTNIQRLREGKESRF